MSEKENARERKETNEIFFRSIIEQDRCPVVICNLEHEILYMNPAAVENYAKRGGEKLIGKSLLACHNPESAEKIKRVTDWFASDGNHNIVYTFHNEKQNKDVYMVAGDCRIPMTGQDSLLRGGCGEKRSRNVFRVSPVPDIPRRRFPRLRSP